MNSSKIQSFLNNCRIVFTTVRFNYILALALSVLSWILVSPAISSSYQLRGGLLANLAFLVFTLIILILAIIRVWFSKVLSLQTKFGLTSLLSPGLLFLLWITIQYLFIALFFGFGWCSTTFISPSQKQTITVEESCFMDCTHSVYRNDYIFQKQIGEMYLDSGKVCKMKDKVIWRWNNDETEVTWQVGNKTGTLSLR